MDGYYPSPNPYLIPYRMISESTVQKHRLETGVPFNYQQAPWKSSTFQMEIAIPHQLFRQSYQITSFSLQPDNGTICEMQEIEWMIFADIDKDSWMSMVYVVLKIQSCLHYHGNGSDCSQTNVCTSIKTSSVFSA